MLIYISGLKKNKNRYKETNINQIKNIDMKENKETVNVNEINANILIEDFKNKIKTIL